MITIDDDSFNDRFMEGFVSEYAKSVAKEASELELKLVRNLFRKHGLDISTIETRKDLLEQGYLLISEATDFNMKKYILVKVVDSIRFSITPRIDSMEMKDES